MNQIIQTIEAGQMKKNIPDFRAGDTVVVQVKIKEGGRERLQAFEGVVIAKRNRGLHSSFRVRKISNGVGVERLFKTHNPLVESITVKRHGDVRRAKLYYLRELSGRAARIKEKILGKFSKETLVPETGMAAGEAELESFVLPEETSEVETVAAEAKKKLEEETAAAETEVVSEVKTESEVKSDD